ncbi:MAG: DNA mismatch repair endonuclease MutL [Candidatus Woesebacteria bacterium]|jgi:DNA mismatch repair protein MutL
MPKIKILSEELQNKIAAGEVIERPASVVKELVENSLDAGADSIKILLENSGLKRIVVADNGLGMDKTDLELATLAHSTSKLEKTEDLLAIQSLGFRGEALASISQISQLNIKSKTDEAEFGSELENYGGKIQTLKPVASTTGTTVIVENLFYSVPVRKKFLKSLATELRKVIQIVSYFALAHADKRFFLSHNGKTVLDLPPQSIELRISNLLGRATFLNLIPLSNNDPYFSISGFISKPQIARKSRRKQFFFVNQRPIKNKIFSAVIKQSYSDLLEKTVYPPFIIFLKSPFENVDVNIHPRKEEVKFLDDQNLIDLTKKTIQQTLEQANLSFQNNAHHFIYQTQQTQKRQYKLKDHNQLSVTKKLLKKNLKPWLNQGKEQDIEISQINGLYLVQETATGLIIIDQHAAHERILYEELSDSFKKQSLAKIKLSKTILLELSVTEAELLKENLEKFRNLAFEIDHFYENTFKVTAIPKILQKRNISKIINELLDDIAQNRELETIDLQSKKLIKYLACRSAIKAGDYLNQAERKKLIAELKKTKSPYTCPHGRPAFIEISFEELAKMFSRT